MRTFCTCLFIHTDKLVIFLLKRGDMLMTKALMSQEKSYPHLLIFISSYFKSSGIY